MENAALGVLTILLAWWAIATFMMAHHNRDRYND